MSAKSRGDDADRRQPVDDILHRQTGKDNGGDAREHHGDLFVQPAFGDNGQAQDDAGRHHHRQQRGIACQGAGQRAGETRIDDNHRHDGRRSGEKRDGQRIDGEVIAVRFIGTCLAGAAATRALGAFALLAFRRQHVQRDQEQDDAAGDLEGGFGDVEIAENPRPAQREEQHDGGGDGSALKRRAKLAGAVLRLGHGKEDRRVADRVDHDEIDDEGGDEALEHGLSLHPLAAPCSHPNR